MSELDSSELEGVTRIFINLGARDEQAEVMAAQLLKRAGQIAEERKISKVEAAETLLKQVIQARSGEQSS
ncbi:MAG TPA: hypothetical protein DCX06_12660 [Opitutae bacterium]|nr:hypothetical protein [Opitutae bacterium]